MKYYVWDAYVAEKKKKKNGKKGKEKNCLNFLDYAYTFRFSKALIHSYM